MSREGLKVATNRRYWIDMTDMAWVPWAMRDDLRFSAAIALRREQLKFLLLDEAQDTDLLQIEMLSLLIDPAQSFLTVVGDRHQACYFFRGALNDGMDRIQKRFQGENLPLPMCYRCGTKHLDLVREVFPNIPIHPRTDAPAGEIRVVLSRDFPRIFDDEHLSYMGVCRKNAPLIKAAIQLLAAGKPAKIKDRNIGGRLVTRVKDICQKQRVKYNPETFVRTSIAYEEAQRKRLQDFPNSENQILDLADMLEAIRALFQAYEPNTFKAWEGIVEKIFDESGYSPISLYTIHSGKGGEGQVSFILYPEDLPLIHPKQVEEEREQEDHLLYVALTRTLADGADGSGILYLVCREASSEDDGDKAKAHEHRGKVNYPEWLPKKYRHLWKWDKSDQPAPDDDRTIEVEAYALENQPELEPETVNVSSKEVAEQPEAIAPTYEPETINALQLETSETPQKQWLNTFANQHHSITRTNADKRNQVELLLHDLEWQILSDRAIADHCNVSAPFVGKIRAELAEAGTVNVNSERVDRKGRKLNTAGIGTRHKLKSAPQPVVAAEAIAPQVTATEPQPEASSVGVLESVFREDQRQEQDRINRATQIKAEISNLKARLAALEAELATM